MNIDIKADCTHVTLDNHKYGNIESRYGLNSLYFTKDNKPYTIITGELHFSRVPKESWKRELLKMKECGINTVSTYVFWNYHEEEKGNFDFSGNNDIKEFLSICKEVEMPCVLRIGPWCHGEVVYGGFPKRINKMRKKRTNDAKYLKEVEDFWTALYNEVSQFLDGDTVIAIQIENEYTGKVNHLRTLREIAEKIGFKAPFFTMTLWPSNKPDDYFLPVGGGYPDAPWSGKREAIKPENRFSIAPIRADSQIGTDLFKSQKTVEKDDLRNIPFATCEIGPGNQVTNLRRPLISEKDGYGVCFAKFASGCNWLGYYMFHGGRNPSGKLMQESRKTGYPNDCPVIDYDFQAPLSRYGECRAHGDLLRLMHLFTKFFDTEIGTKSAYFPKWKSSDPNDISFLKCSVRMNQDMSGYFFASTHEKNLKYNDFKDVEVNVRLDDKSITLPKIDVKSDSMFFYPFNIDIDDVKFDYILAQPIAKVKEDGITVCYFAECEGIVPKYSLNGIECKLNIDTVGQYVDDPNKIKFVVLPIEKAKEFHVINNKVVFAKGTVYTDNDVVYSETIDGYLDDINAKKIDLIDKIKFNMCEKVNLPYNHYLYSYGKKQFYSLEVPSNILDEYFDVELKFNFSALNLQVFSGDIIVNDYFNIDGNFVMRLREYKKYLENGPLIIKTAERTKFGAGNVYQEIIPPKSNTHLVLESANAIQVLEKELNV